MSIFTNVLTGGSNNHETTAENANGHATDLVNEGIVGAIANTSGVAPATGGFAVNAQSPAAMAVDVTAGVAYVTATPTSQNSQTLRVRSTATEAVTIAANASGSTKYDWVYLSVSAANAANPNAAGDNVTTLVTSRSTSSSNDDGTPPTYGYLLAIVTVANGASSIANGSIADSRTNVTGPVNFVDTQAIKNDAVTGAKSSVFPLATNRQDIASNTTPSDPHIQFGWTYVTGDAANLREAITITFPVAYDTVPIVIAGSIGYRTGSNPSTIGDLSSVASGLGDAGWLISVHSITTTTCVIEINKHATAIPSAVRLGLGWVAIGPKAR